MSLNYITEPVDLLTLESFNLNTSNFKVNELINWQITFAHKHVIDYNSLSLKSIFLYIGSANVCSYYDYSNR